MGDWSDKLAAEEEQVDVVFDFAPSGLHSAESWEKAQKVLVKGGKFIGISGDDPQGQVTVSSFIQSKIKGAWRNTFGNHKCYSVLKQSDSKKLEELAGLVQDGQLKPVIDQVFEWEQAPAAFK